MAKDRPSVGVRRCLFGRPTAAQKEEFKTKMIASEVEQAQRFQKTWGYDVLNDSFDTNEWRKEGSDADIPEFYKRGLRRKVCRRKPIVRCVGKALIFDDLEEDKYCDVADVPSVAENSVTYEMHDHIELFLRVPSQFPRSRNTLMPTPTVAATATPSTTNNGLLVSMPETYQTPTRNFNENTSLPSVNSNSENVRPVRRQLNITDQFKTKKRARSTSEDTRSKRDRRDS